MNIGPAAPNIVSGVAHDTSTRGASSSSPPKACIGVAGNTSKQAKHIEGDQKGSLKVPFFPNEDGRKKMIHGLWENSPGGGSKRKAGEIDVSRDEGAPPSKKLRRTCFSARARSMKPFNQILAVKLLSRIHSFTSILASECEADMHPAPGNPCMKIPKETALKIDGNYIDANYIYLSGDETGNPAMVLCGYPHANDLENHVKMLHDERPSVLVVLAESEEIGTDRLEYFKESLDFGKLHFHSEPGKTLPGRNGEFEMQCYEASIWEDGGEKVSLPVLHVVNWKDGTAATVDQMAAVVEMMHSIQIKDEEESGSPRVPVLHCRAGVGRSGQTAGAFLLAYSRCIRSVEDLIRDMRMCRGSEAVYLEAQQTALGTIGAMRGYPVFDEQWQENLKSNIRHTGYENLVGSQPTGTNFMAILEEEKCLFRKTEIPLRKAKYHLSPPNISRGPMVLNEIRDGEIVRQTLWNPELNKGRDTDSGDIFDGNPLAFWQEKIAQNVASCDALETIHIFPPLPTWKSAAPSDEEYETSDDEEYETSSEEEYETPEGDVTIVRG